MSEENYCADFQTSKLLSNLYRKNSPTEQFILE